LLEYTMREMFKQRLRSQLPDGSLFSPENLARLILMVCELLAETGRQCPPPHGQLEPLMEKQIKAELYEVLYAWLAEASSGKTERRPTPEQAAMITSWAIYGAAVQWSQKEQPEPAQEFVQQVLPIIIASLNTSVAGSAQGGVVKP
jgi:hypothetical protein